MLEKTEKRFKIKIKGKSTCVVREQYLRDDVACHSPLCQRNCINQKDSKEMLLNKDASHYAIPCYDIIEKYFEVFEIPDISGVIILQSFALKALREIGRKHYERILNVARNSRHGCAIFLNEVSRETCVMKNPNQSTENWITESTKKTVEWYDGHLKGNIPIILITEKTEAYKSLQDDRNIKVLTLRIYLEEMWNNIKSALELYDSISASLTVTDIKDSSKPYPSYLPVEVLETGIKAGSYFKGFLRVHKHHATEEAFISSSKVHCKDSGDILIFGMKHRNRAIHGDEVVVELLPKNEWRAKCQSLSATVEGERVEHMDSSKINSTMPTGKVVGVLDKRWRDYVATLPEENEETSNVSKMSSERILVIPYDYRIPKIRIATKQAEKLQNQRIIVRIDNWEVDSQYPNGHFVRSLGEINQLETEVISLLMEHNIPLAEFPSCLSQELPTNTQEKPWKVSEEEAFKRKDLRQSYLIFSIDPKGCEDVDDALSVRNLSNGRIELGVHIADVTYFVQPFSVTDFEARSRSISVYLPDRRYNMLPHVLSGELCSLLGNVDRYAVSVLWELDNMCEVKNVWFGRTVLKSRYKLCYEAAQDILLRKSVEEIQSIVPELQNLKGKELDFRFRELKTAIEMLAYISRTLRMKRFAVGALELGSINIKFELNNEKPSTVVGIKPAEEMEAHKIVAECMIFANHWVAKKISEVFPQQSLLRQHPSPRESDLLELQKLANSKGYIFKVGSNKELANSLELAADPKDDAVNQIFCILATHAMNQALYFSTGCSSPPEFYHYGLGLEIYTHFTSPIRRYADILVHRLLLAAVEIENPYFLLKNMELQNLCQHMNDKHRAAQDVEKAALELFQSFYFSDYAAHNDENIDCIADGIIYSLKANGVLVYIPSYKIKSAVCLCNKDKKVALIKNGVQWVDGHLERCQNELQVKALGYVQKYNIFHHITVCIKVQKSKAHPSRVILELVNNQPYFIQPPTLLKKIIKGESEPSKHFEHICNEADTSKQIMEAEAKAKSLYEVLQQLKTMSLCPNSNEIY